MSDEERRRLQEADAGVSWRDQTLVPAQRARGSATAGEQPQAAGEAVAR